MRAHKRVRVRTCAHACAHMHAHACMPCVSLGVSASRSISTSPMEAPATMSAIVFQAKKPSSEADAWNHKRETGRTLGRILILVSDTLPMPS